MREISFRGKTENGRWAYGSLICFPDNQIGIVETSDLELAWGTGVWSFSYTAVDPKTIGQDIGLKDSKGEKIFEGDILNTINGIEFILFNDGMFGSASPGYPHEPLSDWGGLWGEDHKIIGNIYDNPELLKKNEKSKT